jgi:hypothetical protein
VGVVVLVALGARVGGRARGQHRERVRGRQRRRIVVLVLVCLSAGLVVVVAEDGVVVVEAEGARLLVVCIVVFVISHGRRKRSTFTKLRKTRSKRQRCGYGSRRYPRDSLWRGVVFGVF